MRPSKRSVDLIRLFEGYKAKAYLDVRGIPTIGIGHTLDVRLGQHVRTSQAERLLAMDLSATGKIVAELVKAPVSQSQFDALVSFAFSVGCGSLAKSRLLRKLNAGDENGAANELLLWDKCDRKRVPALTVRRRSEHSLFVHRAAVAA